MLSQAPAFPGSWRVGSVARLIVYRVRRSHRTCQRTIEHRRQHACIILSRSLATFVRCSRHHLDGAYAPCRKPTSSAWVSMPLRSPRVDTERIIRLSIIVVAALAVRCTCVAFIGSACRRLVYIDGMSSRSRVQLRSRPPPRSHRVYPCSHLSRPIENQAILDPYFSRVLANGRRCQTTLASATFWSDGRMDCICRLGLQCQQVDCASMYRGNTRCYPVQGLGWNASGGTSLRVH